MEQMVPFLSIISTVAIGVGFIWAVKNSVGILRIRLEMQDGLIHEIKAEIKELTKVTVSMAIQNQRLVTLEDRLLAQGKRLDALANRINHKLDAELNRLGKLFDQTKED